MLDLTEYENIWIYGFNNIGRNAYRLLKQIYGEKVCGILESITQHEGTLAFDDVEITPRDFVYVCMNSKHHQEILVKLKGLNVAVYTKDADAYYQKIGGGQPLLENRFLSFCVGQACSLKCKDCANFAPYAHKEHRRYELEDIKKNIDLTLKFFSRIDVVHVQGGEPFVYSELKEVLEYLLRYKDIFGKLQIATNGTIVPQKELLEFMSQNADVIEVRVSHYPNVLANSLINTLKAYQIRYRYYNFANKDNYWIKTGGIDFVDTNESEEYRNRKVWDCMWRNCFTVESGLIGRCARSIPSLSLQETPYIDGDYIELGKSSPEKVRDYFMFINPMQACKRCTGNYGKKIEPAIQIEGE